MVGKGVLIGEAAQRSGVSRKALRLYEAAGILPPPRRAPSGYRMYDREALNVLSFVRQAQRLGFTLAEIKDIVAIRRTGGVPCLHIRDLVRRKAQELDQRLTDLAHVRKSLRTLLKGWRSSRTGAAAVCPHIERAARHDKGG